MPRSLPFAVAAVLTALALVSVPGCGVRGSLDAPKGEKTETGGATPGKPGEPVPHKPSILDPLIR
jgi:predicted small lipoprotein YifL